MDDDFLWRFSISTPLQPVLSTWRLAFLMTLNVSSIFSAIVDLQHISQYILYASITNVMQRDLFIAIIIQATNKSTCERFLKGNASWRLPEVLCFLIFLLLYDLLSHEKHTCLPSTSLLFPSSHAHLYTPNISIYLDAMMMKDRPYVFPLSFPLLTIYICIPSSSLQVISWLIYIDICIRIYMYLLLCMATPCIVLVLPSSGIHPPPFPPCF